MFSRRRKSVSPAPTADSNSDTEKRRRRRLSKPMTNKSSTNLRLHALQQENTSRNNSVTNIPQSPIPSQTAFSQPRELIRAHIFNSDTDLPSARSLTANPGGWKGAAFVLMNAGATHSVDRLPLTPVKSASPTKKPKRPFSAIFGSRPSSNNILKPPPQSGSIEEIDTPLRSPVSLLSPGESCEDVSNIRPVRNQRRSSFNPGEATRLDKSSPAEKRADEGLAGIEEHPTQAPPARFSFEEEWKLPPRISRIDTPSDLECTHIGGLRLGSLQVINGRASPAPSELSKHLKVQALPLARRDTSSEYGDSEVTEVPTIRTRMLSGGRNPIPGFEAKAREMAEHSPQFGNADVAEPAAPCNSIKSSTPDRFPSMVKRKPVASADKTSIMALAYMAEMPDSPFSAQRSSSPTGSVIVTTSKATEFDDKLFDDETMAPSIASEADRATIDTWYTPSDAGSIHEDAFSSTVEFQRVISPQRLRPPEEHRITEKSDSGYSSNVSLRDDISEDAKVIPGPVSADNQTSGIPESLPDKPQQSRIRLMRPTSILKQSRVTAPELPTFSNLKQISSPPHSAESNKSFPSPKPLKPKKLQKLRPVSRPLPVGKITVQGANIDQADIPPVPPEILANLSIRSQTIPELDKTFKTMQHTRNQPSMSTMSLAATDVRFPSPEPDTGEVEARTRPLSFRRRSFVGRTPSEKRLSQQQAPNGISETDAMAIIHGGFGSVVSSLGSNPYDAVPGRNPPPPSSGNTGMTMFQARAPQPRPKSMMDDQTAAELARLRSRAAFEREKMFERRAFNDRGGIPGRNLRPSSIASDTPPLPPMPSKHQSWQQGSYTSSQNQYNPNLTSERIWSEHGGEEQEEAPVPVPPKHSPRPMFIEPADEVEDLTLAPPPPSHSPRPMTIESGERGADVWAAQAEAWKSRRLAAGMLNSSRSFEEAASSGFFLSQHAEIEPLYPDIPPRQQSGFHPRQDHWQSPRQQYPSPNSYSEGYDEPVHRPLPQPSGNSYWADQIERPRSRASQISNAGSLAESLHPPDMERPQPPPQFGRYSGGLNYGYEKEAGFGGSAGTRSVSGKADAARKGIQIRAGYGVDLGDIPIIAGIQRV